MSRDITKKEYLEAIEDFEKKLRFYPWSSVHVYRRVLVAEAIRLLRCLHPNDREGIALWRKVRGNLQSYAVTRDVDPFYTHGARICYG